jgi:hypothetical protein
MVPGQCKGQKAHDTSSQPIARCDGGVHLSSQLHGRLRSGGSWLHASPGKKVHETPISTEKSWAWWYMPVIPVMAGSINR